MTPTMTSRSLGGQSAPIVDDISELLRNKGNVESVAASQTTDFTNLTEMQAYFDESIEARPLMMPSMLDITIKRHEYAYRFFQHKASNGLRLAQALNMGWAKATAEDVTPVNENLSTSDGIICGDVILLKMRKEIYFGLLKKNVQDAVRAGSRAGIAEHFSRTNEKGQSGSSTLNNVDKSKINIFVPPQDVIDAKNKVIDVKL